MRRSFLAKALFGAEKLDSGSIYIKGIPAKLSSPSDAIKNGIAFMSELARIGSAIIFISSEFSELIGMCDRILVLRQGKIAREYSKREMDYHSILRSAIGLQNG